MTNIKTLKSLEFYSGAMSPLAIHSAGIECALAIDFSTSVQKAFEQNFKDDKYIPFWNMDIGKLSSNEILARAKMSVGDPFLMVITSPCPGFSVAGKKDPFDEKNALFLHGQKMVKEIKPEVAIFENVPGMSMPFMTPIWNEIKHRFAELSNEYYIECRKMNALFFGACQARERLIFICVRRDLGFLPPFPAPDVDGAASRRIRDIFPYLDGVYAGQSDKIVRLPDSYLMTATAGESFKMMENGLLRNATIEELKKIAGLPDWFSFEGLSEAEIHRIVGNGVPVQFMQRIVETIRDKYFESLQPGFIKL